MVNRQRLRIPGSFLGQGGGGLSDEAGLGKAGRRRSLPQLRHADSKSKLFSATVAVAAGATIFAHKWIPNTEQRTWLPAQLPSSSCQTCFHKTPGRQHAALHISIPSKSEAGPGDPVCNRFCSAPGAEEHCLPRGVGLSQDFIPVLQPCKSVPGGLASHAPLHFVERPRCISGVLQLLLFLRQCATKSALSSLQRSAGSALLDCHALGQTHGAQSLSLSLSLSFHFSGMNHLSQLLDAQFFKTLQHHRPQDLVSDSHLGKASHLLNG